MTTFSFYSSRIFKISPYINLKKILGRILAPPSGRRPGADAPPCPPLATPLTVVIVACISYWIVTSVMSIYDDIRVKSTIYTKLIPVGFTVNTYYYRCTRSCTMPHRGLKLISSENALIQISLSKCIII